MRGRCGALGLGQQAVVHAGVLQVGPAAAGQQLVVGWQGDARLCVYRPGCVCADRSRQKVVQMVGLELEGRMLCLKPRFLVGRLVRLFVVAQVTVQHHHVHPAHGPRPVPPHASGQLDERAHGRGFDHGPVVVVVSAHFGHGAAQHDEQVVGLGVAVNEGAQGRAEQRRVVVDSGASAVEQGVQLLFDGRAQQQRELRVVHAQVNADLALQFWRQCVWRVHGEGHVVQRGNVGHADKAQAHALAAGRVGAVVVGVLVQLPRLFQHQAGKVLSPLRFLHAVPVFRQGRNLRQPPHLGLLELGNPLVHVPGVRFAEGSSVRASLRGLVELVDPQAADVDRLAGPFAAVALVHGPPGAVGQKQPFHQRGRQRGR